ncbi:serine/threonine-protein kinase [Actinomadura macrotermitis]|uniref:serine/threonine-protein kinase n=1 Tax=Actinomadura macrotermitis TaxID=2585200 RepID=UPI0018868C6B|nr:serine/threonine-protein kinase [Actinomadura macrotermitis]
MAGHAGELINGRYRLTAELGRGGMGRVWQAHDEMLDRDVAVKEIAAAVDLDDATRRSLTGRAMREARAAARLNHPGIVTVYDVALHDDRPLIVMELVRGRSLAEIVAEQGPLPVRRAAVIGLALLEALREAHAAGIVHRDLKPANVLVTGRRVVITDFGLSTLAGDVRITRSGSVLGTPAYMAPEQAEGLGTGPATDLWGLGATLYTAVEGRPPYQGGEFVAILSALLTRPPDPPRRAGALQPLLAALLQRDPAKRPAPEHVAGMLERAAQAPEPPGAEPPPGYRGDAATTSMARHGTLPPPSPVPAGPYPPGPQQWGAAPARPRWGLVAVAALIILAGVAGVATLFAVVDTGDPKADPAPSAAGSPSAAAVSPPIGPAGPPTGTPDLPSGYSTYADSSLGYSVAIPESWTNTWNASTQTRKLSDTHGHAIYVSKSAKEPLDACNGLVTTFQTRTQSWSNFQQLRLERIDYGSSAAELEYIVFDKVSNASFHGLDRTFTLPGGGYNVNLSSLPADWEQSRTVYATFFATFRTT